MQTKTQISLRIHTVFVVRCLDSISIVSLCAIARLCLVAEAEQASLSLTWSQTPIDRFSHDEAHTIGNCSLKPSLVYSYLVRSPCFQKMIRLIWLGRLIWVFADVILQIFSHSGLCAKVSILDETINQSPWPRYSCKWDVKLTSNSADNFSPKSE